MTNITEINKIVRLGTKVNCGGGRFYSVFCKIEYSEGRLSISGVEGPLPSGNALGGCGQIDMDLRPEQFNNLAPEWSRAKIRKFLDTWKRWHLNDMKAGSPRQEAYLEKHPVEYKYPESHYDKARQALGKAGLNPDLKYMKDGKPYKYGSAWIYEDVPQDVLSWLKSLPDTDKQPAWV